MIGALTVSFLLYVADYETKQWYGSRTSLGGDLKHKAVRKAQRTKYLLQLSDIISTFIRWQERLERSQGARDTISRHVFMSTETFEKLLGLNLIII